LPAAVILTSNTCASGAASDSQPDTYKPPPNSDTPPLCTPHKDSPSTRARPVHRRRIPATALHHADRRRVANHLYLQAVGYGDTHSILWPETVCQSTPTDLLEQILARDDAARTTTTLQRDQHDPAAQIADATRRSVDAVCVAAEDLA
jgi:hypothetical protein